MRKDEFKLIDEIRNEEFEKGKEAAVAYLVNNCYIRFAFDKKYILQKMKDVKRKEENK